MQNRKTVVLSLLCLLIFSGITVQMTVSYFSDIPNPLTNIFTMGKVQIDLIEENWKESDADAVHPMQTIKKDPVIVNTGTNPAFVFLEVSVPIRTIAVVNTDAKKTEAAPTELFTYEYDQINWEFLFSQKSEDTVQYIYGYKKVLYPGERTVALFDTVCSVNYLEGELNREEFYYINIQGKAVQSQIDTENLSLSQIYELLPDESESTGGIQS